VTAGARGAWVPTRPERVRARTKDIYAKGRLHGAGLTRRGTRGRQVIPLALVAGLALVVVTGDTPAQPQTLGVPAYFYPAPNDGYWRQLTEAPRGTIVIVNPASGPGPSVDARYAAMIPVLERAGCIPYGYVDTAYGFREPDQIVAEARLWSSWYGVKAVFLDQTAPTAAHLDYYRGIVGRLHADGFEVAMNPGQPEVDPRYLDLVEHVVLFEGAYETYLAASFPAWVKDYPPARVWHLVYDVPDSAVMSNVVRLARARHAGVVYATDGVMPNPWQSLPPYWAAERRLTQNGR
jgi:hypothetical protein